MKLEMNPTNRAIAVGVVFAVLAFVFWTQLLSPKREEAKQLETQVGQLQSSLSLHQAEIVDGEAAKREFSSDYQRLVVVGKAVPGDDDIASLLVQVNRLADNADGTFRDIQLSAEGGEEAAAAPPAAGDEPASATEVAASLLPLGASVGPAGLAVMPYSVTFDGNFFEIANFIKGLDSLVDTKPEEVIVDGRLVTVDGFSLEADPDKGFPALQASFALTTYLTPPGEGAGASPESAGPEAAPVAATTGALP
jgi:Tfp pilus assembly protein PilO